MEIKSVFCVIDADQDDTILSRAMDFVETLDAHLVVMVTADAPKPPISAYEMTHAEIWTMETKKAKARAVAKAEEVEKIVAKRNIPAKVTSQITGPSDLATRAANVSRYSDIVLLDTDADQALQDPIVTGALFESAAPILFGGNGAELTASPKHVLIAWNATRESSRAVKEAMPFLKSATEVTALLVDPEPSFNGHGEEPGADLGHYLAQHGVSATIVKCPTQGKPVDAVIGQQIQDCGADMLVMGGYGHSRLRERIFGGTTRAIMKQPPCTVLMAH